MVSAVLWLGVLVFGLQDDWTFKIRKQSAVVSSQQTQQSRGATADPLPAAPPDEAQVDDYYVVMYSATWCGPCRGWKAGQMPKLQASGVGVTVVDCDRDPQWNRARKLAHPDTGKEMMLAGISAYPTIEIVRKRDRWPVFRTVGPASAQSLLQKIAELKKLAAKPAAKPVAKPEPVSMKWDIEGDRTPTLEQTAAHLRDDHKIDVTGLSHQQMLRLHDAIHDAEKAASP